MIIIASLLLICRIFSYNYVRKKSIYRSFFDVFGDILTPDYFIPVALQSDDSSKVRSQKRMANWFLYLFYIAFIAVLVIALFRHELIN